MPVYRKLKVLLPGRESFSRVLASLICPLTMTCSIAWRDGKVLVTVRIEGKPNLVGYENMRPSCVSQNSRLRAARTLNGVE